MRRLFALLVVLTLLAGACGGSDPDTVDTSADEQVTLLPDEAESSSDPAEAVSSSDVGAGDAASTSTDADADADEGETDASSAVDAGDTEVVADEAITAPPIEYGDRFPQVLAVQASPSGDEWQFSVTLSSTYDTPERYADAWRVLDENDNELGIRVLLHDHANEQPFTRSERISIPSGTTTVFVEGRDQANGWSGQRFAFVIPPVDLAEEDG